MEWTVYLWGILKMLLWGYGLVQPSSGFNMMTGFMTGSGKGVALRVLLFTSMTMGLLAVMVSCGRVFPEEWHSSGWHACDDRNFARGSTEC